MSAFSPSSFQLPGTSYNLTTMMANCNASQTCVAPWGCLYTKNVGLSDIGFGMGVASPYQIDIFQLCSPSNPLAMNVYPCSVLNAGLIVSAGLGGAGLLLLFGFALLMRIGALPKLEVTEEWGAVFNNLSIRIEDGSRRLVAYIFNRVFLFSIFWFCVIFLTFTIRQRYDLTDGIRIGGAFLMGVVLCLMVLTCSFIGLCSSLNNFAHTVKTYGAREALRIGFESACAGAFASIGTALLGLCGAYLLLTLDRNDPSTKGGYPTVQAYSSLPTDAGSEYFAYGNRCRTTGNGSFCGQVLSLQSLCGFTMGISFVALMVRSMTGIFAKAAEVGDELVDKLENTTIDQAKNPAQGLDYLGNFALEAIGQTSDLMESLVISILATAFLAQGDSARIAIPFWIAGFGLFSAIIGQVTVFARYEMVDFESRFSTAMGAFKTGQYVTTLFCTGGCAVAIAILFQGGLPQQSVMGPSIVGSDSNAWRYFGVCAIGLGTNILVWEATSYFTSHRAAPTQSVAASGVTGTATALIQGFGIGMFSCLPTVVLLSCDIIGSHAIAGQYGVALSAVATAIPVAYYSALNLFAPLIFTASSVICGSETHKDLKQILAPMDLVGMAHLAELRGWSVACAMKAAIAVLLAFKDESGQQHNVDLFRYFDGMSTITMANSYDPVMTPLSVPMNRGGIGGDVIGEGIVLGAAVLGAFLPLMCAGINVLAVGKTTRAMVDDSRIQMRNNAYNMDQSMRAAMYPTMMGSLLPVVWAIGVPAFVGFLIGPRVLLGLVAGGILSAGLLAVFSVNSGSCWAKSEACIAYEGILGGADSEAHRASWIATRLGGVLKDLVGPTAITMMKTMAMTSLLIAPLIFTDKDIFSTTLDNMARRPPANELTLYVCPSAPTKTWFYDGFVSASYLTSCILARSTVVSGSVLSCFDWNKAYWSGIPAAILVVFTLAIFFSFWMAETPPLNLPSNPISLLLSQPSGTQSMSFPIIQNKPEFIPIHTTRMVPMQVRTETQAEQPVMSYPTQFQPVSTTSMIPTYQMPPQQPQPNQAFQQMIRIAPPPVQTLTQQDQFSQRYVNPF